MIHYDRDHLPEGDWADYRKRSTTRMIAVSGPLSVQTKEGAYQLPSGWEGFIALDVGGDPYPIDASVASASYERVS